MYEAALHDPAHGDATAQGNTPEEAVEAAFKELALGWMHPNDIKAWPEDAPFFDGEIREKTEAFSEVWWHNRAWAMIGTVYPIG